MSPPPPPRRFRLIRSVQIFLVAAALLAVVTSMTGLRNDVEAVDTVGGALFTSCGLISGFLCLLRSALVRGDRLAWAVFGVGLVCYGLGNVYLLTARARGEHVPIPSLADFGGIVLYPAFFIAMVLLLRGRVTKFHRSMWLDALIAALGVVALASGIAVATAGLKGEDDVIAVGLNLAYEVSDLVLIVLLVTAFSLFSWRPGKLWWLLGISLLGLAAGDAIFVIAVANGTEDVILPLTQGLWTVAITTPAFATWQRQSYVPAATMSGWGVLLVPFLLAFCSLGLLVACAADVPVRFPVVTVVLAAATVVTALIRAGLTFNEVNQLAESRTEARTDELTGLANRRGFLEGVAHAERRFTGEDSFALLLLDLDRFKDVNDSLGHQLGDHLLTLVGHRIASALRPGDLLARLGGDEFAVLLEHADLDAAHGAAERMQAALRPPFEMLDATLHIDASVGVATFPAHAGDFTTLLQRADIAMYAAKSKRSGVEHYQPGSAANSLLRLDMIETLRSAFGTGQLEVYYQPKVDLKSGLPCGAEALVRWRHPTRGLLEPKAFVPLAEHAGLMRPLTAEVLELSLAQCRRWWDLGLSVSVAVNLSAPNLLDPAFPTQVTELLAHNGLPARALELELTETTLMFDRARSTTTLDNLRKRGVRIALDDYGTGYSSLAYLRELPVDTIKLDKSFTLALDDKRAATIVRSTVGLAHNLGLTIVAEGVEDPEAVPLLKELGCDLAQGYYFGAPEPAERLTAAMLRRGKIPA